MKHVLKKLEHKGIYVPPYDFNKFKIGIRGETIPLSEKSEQMAGAWIRKRHSALSPPDKVFLKNFMREVLEQLKMENPSSSVLRSFPSEYLNEIDNYEGNDICKSDASINKKIDFTEIEKHLQDEKDRKEKMSPNKKKQEAEQRKVKREENKQTYGYADVDGQRLEIAN